MCDVTFFKLKLRSVIVVDGKTEEQKAPNSRCLDDGQNPARIRSIINEDHGKYCSASVFTVLPPVKDK